MLPAGNNQFSFSAFENIQIKAAIAAPTNGPSMQAKCQLLHFAHFFTGFISSIIIPLYAFTDLIVLSP